MFCKKCGTEATKDSKFCKACGAPLTAESISSYNSENPHVNQVQNVGASEYNILAVLSFIMGIVSLFLTLWGLSGIAAIILGFIGIAKFNSATEKNKWMAVLGIIMGAFNLIYFVVQIVRISTLFY